MSSWRQLKLFSDRLLGVKYSVAGLDPALEPATSGLRNLTGKVNEDGTVTLYAITSTVSASGDQGADPNELVAIADTLSNTTAEQAADEQFSVIDRANYGEVLRGVSFAPQPTPVPEPSETAGITALSILGLRGLFLKKKGSRKQQTKTIQG